MLCLSGFELYSGWMPLKGHLLTAVKSVVNFSVDINITS